MAKRDATFITEKGIFNGQVEFATRQMRFLIDRTIDLEIDGGAVILNDSMKPMFVDVLETFIEEHRTVLDLIRDERTMEFLTEEIMPRINNSLQYEYPISEKVLSSFVDVGIARRELYDTCIVCPECKAIHTSRPGCNNCGSGRVRAEELVHHYACGHVGSIHEFDQGNGIMKCVKCRKVNLIPSIDYDITRGLILCNECGNRMNTPLLIGQCLNPKCGTRFLVSEGITIELFKYTIKDANV